MTTRRNNMFYNRGVCDGLRMVLGMMYNGETPTAEKIEKLLVIFENMKEEGDCNDSSGADR